MSSPLAKRGSARTPTPSRKKRESQAINEPESSTRPIKRTNGFAYLGNDQEELEELCHSFSVVADQRWRTPHASTTGLSSSKPTNENDKVDGSLSNSTVCQNTRMLSKLYSKPILQNPLNARPYVSRPQSQTSTHTKDGVSLARISLQPGEHISAPPRRNDVEISYVNILQRLRNSDKHTEVEMEMSSHSPEVVFYPPDYEKENMWSQVDFEEITTLEGEVAVDYYGTGKWVIDKQEVNPLLWRSPGHMDVPSVEETTPVVGLRGGAVPAVGSSEKDSSEADGQASTGEARGTSTEVESEEAEESTKEEAEAAFQKQMEVGSGGPVTRSMSMSMSMNAKSAKGKEPEAEMQNSTRQARLSTHDHGSAAMSALGLGGHREDMTDAEWIEGMESIDRFAFQVER